MHARTRQPQSLLSLWDPHSHTATLFLDCQELGASRAVRTVRESQTSAWRSCRCRRFGQHGRAVDSHASHTCCAMQSSERRLCKIVGAAEEDPVRLSSAGRVATAGEESGQTGTREPGHGAVCGPASTPGRLLLSSAASTFKLAPCPAALAAWCAQNGEEFSFTLAESPPSCFRDSR